MSGWKSYKVELWAIVDLAPTGGAGPPERKTLEVCRCVGRFPLNAQPNCSITLPLGREAQSLRAAPIHAILDGLTYKQKVEVWAKLEPLSQLNARASNLLPVKPFKVFEGSTVGFGYERTGESVSYQIELEHWLSDLSYASCVSAASAPTNPASMIFSALTVGPETEEGVAASGGFTGLTIGEEFLTEKNVITDFWGKALQPFLLALAASETFVETDAAFDTGFDLNDISGNLAAVRALKRIEPLPGPGYARGVPLPLDPKAYGGDMEIVAEQISASMSNETIEMVASHTIWDKMVQYASDYLFAISPLVDRALVVPFIPGLRSTYKTIYADEYDYAKTSGEMPRVLRGVGIYGGGNFEGGADLSGDEALDYEGFSVGGYFEGAKSGQILFKQCPSWMVNTSFSNAHTASGGNAGVRGNAINPGVGAAPANPGPKDKAVANAVLMDKYAEALYVYEVLKHRSGDIGGPFRMDIAPGSNIRLEGCGEKFLGVNDLLGQELWAVVLQVDFFLDADRGTAGTAFRLAHLRNRAENAMRGASVDRHPIWNSLWTGAPLVRF